MKRVAILGCSHSDVEQGKDEWTGWVRYMADDNPDIIFDNYARMAHGPLYYDIVLKYILTECPYMYDSVIIQFTIPNRWLLPLNTSTVNMEFKLRSVTPNYNNIDFLSDRIALTSSSAFGCTTPDKSSQLSDLYDTVLKYYTTDNVVNDNSHLSRKYESYFYKTLDKLYAPHIVNLFYFDWGNGYGDVLTSTDNPRDNLGHTQNFLKWAVSKYGEREVIGNFLDDSLHCNSKGNYILYNEYIKTTKIGYFLKDRQ